MITCQNCGAANRDGSQTCSKCGKTLSAPSAQRCPMCGTFNPPGKATCASCGARLTPKAASPAPETSPAQPHQELTKPAPPPPPPAAAGESDDWLSRLRGALPEQSVAEQDAPDWLRGAMAAPAVEPEFDLAARLRGAAEPTTAPAEAEVPDWLTQLAPTPATRAPGPSAPAAPPPVEAEVPDWLKQVAPTPTKAKAPEPPAPPPAEAEVPDWLTQLTPPPTTRAPGPSAPAAPPPVEAEVPDWLKQVAPTPVTRAPEPSAPAAPPLVEAEVPDWLTQLAPTPATRAPGPSAPAAHPLVEAEVPDWLTQLAPPPATRAPEPSAPAVPPLVEAEVPDWLAQLTPTAAPAKGPELIASAAPPVTEPETSEWLKGLSPTKAPAPSASPLVGEQAPVPAEIPAWLQEIGGPAPAAPPVSAVMPEATAETLEWLKGVEPSASGEAAAPFVEELPPAPGEMPAWLKEIEPTGAAVPGPVAATPAQKAPSPVPPAPPEPAIAAAPVEGGLVAAQLPSWLEALKPKAIEPTAAPKEEEPVELEGILEGVRGALPVADVAWQPLGAGISMRPQITPDELARAGALQELLARGAATPVRREGESRAQKLWGGTQRLFVFLVIAVAAILPLFPGASLGLVGAPQLSEAGGKMYENIDGIKSGDRVLVAFDYDATQAPEMDALARAVVRHLLARKARVSVVSLYPAGPAAAQVVINGLVSGTAPITITNVGYMPGQSTAIPYILGTVPFSQVIELAAVPDTVRWWAEQLPRSDPPLLWAGVSAQAEPMSQPYLTSRQVGGMIVGVPDAIAYELKLGLFKPGVAPLDSIAIANAALIVLIVLGGVIQLILGGAPTPENERRRK